MLCRPSQGSGLVGETLTERRRGRRRSARGTACRSRFHVKHRRGRPSVLLWRNVEICGQPRSERRFHRWITCGDKPGPGPTRSRAGAYGRPLGLRPATTGAADRTTPTRSCVSLRPAAAAPGAAAATIPTRGPPRPLAAPRSPPRAPPSPSRPISGSAQPPGCRGRSCERSPPPRPPRSPSSPPAPRAGATSGIDQPSSRSSGATAREVTTSNRRSTVQLLGPRTHHLHLVGQAELARRPRRGTWCAAAAAPRASPARRAAPAPAPARAARLRSRCRTPATPAGTHSDEHRAVEDVPVPEPGHLARTDQASLDAGTGQQGGVPLDQRQPDGREHPPGHLGHGGCFT